jgi:hypothetical protein
MLSFFWCRSRWSSDPNSVRQGSSPGVVSEAPIVPRIWPTALRMSCVAPPAAKSAF